MNETNFYHLLPKKQAAAGALFFNSTGQLLILHPTYKNRWEIPGGAIEENESPKEAVEREIREELGLNIKVKRMLVCDYWHPFNGQPENFRFIFEGGVLADEEIKTIKLKEDEIASFEFMAIDSDEQRKQIAEHHGLGPRVLKALEAMNENRTFYLENAKDVS